MLPRGTRLSDGRDEAHVLDGRCHVSKLLPHQACKGRRRRSGDLWLSNLGSTRGMRSTAGAQEVEGSRPALALLLICSASRLRSMAVMTICCMADIWPAALVRF